MFCFSVAAFDYNCTLAGPVQNEPDHFYASGKMMPTDLWQKPQASGHRVLYRGLIFQSAMVAAKGEVVFDFSDQYELCVF